MADVVSDIRDSLKMLDENLARLAAVLDEKRDEADFDAGMAEVRAGRVWPHSVARRLVAGEHPIKIFREQRGMSQGDLARAAGTSRNYVSQIETGVRRPGRSLRKRIAAALGVEPADFDGP
jgi:DNA-binding XRE family transcriptional regulator